MGIRTKVNLSLDPDLTAEARALGLNMSRIAEVERDDLPLARFRSF